MDLLQISLAIVLFLIAFALVKIGIPFLVRASKIRRLLDHPEESRKIHTRSTPSLGGIVIVSAVWLAFSLHPSAMEFSGFGFMLASSIVLFIVAIKDDLFVVAPSKKLLSQLTAACIMIFGAGVYVQTFGGVFGIVELPYWGSVLMSIAIYIVVINAVNLIDGVDGLAASVVIIASLFFGYWFYSAGIYPLAIFSTVFVGAMSGFLWHNREPAKIFMGDTGALLSGFYLSILGIEFLNTATTYPALFSWQSAAPAILIAVLIVPLYDTLRIFTIRVLTGKSPFKADAGHIHHQLLDSGMSHSQVTLTIVGLQLLVLLTTLLLSPYLSVNYMLLAVIGMSFLVFPTLSFKRKIISTLTKKSFEKKNGHDEKISLKSMEKINFRDNPSIYEDSDTNSEFEQEEMQPQKAS